MFLLEYQTFSGAMAYQPCSRGIDLHGFFKAFKPIERGGDDIFRIARSWSCIVQSIHGLPKDIRWILATIYDFASEMMRPGTSEDCLWAMRSWLMYWFDTAETLFEKYDYPIYAPVMNWFSRPETVSVDDDDRGAELYPDDYASFLQGSTSSDGNVTIVHHRSEPIPNKSAAHRLYAPVSPAINAWMADQPDWMRDSRHPLGFAARGMTLSRSEPILPSRPWASSSESDRQDGGSGVFRWNPEAMEFHVHIHQPSAFSTSTSTSRISEDFMGGHDTSSESDGLSRDERSISSTEHVQFMIEAHGRDIEMTG
ncbi:hypothetical protein E4U21_006452 [Claviceps maximensis]|nr:hypothetical protein E4U21_006452 [Claviceps maximensis]